MIKEISLDHLGGAVAATGLCKEGKRWLWRESYNDGAGEEGGWSQELEPAPSSQPWQGVAGPASVAPSLASYLRGHLELGS